MKLAVRALRERKENRVEDITIPAMEGAALDTLDLLDLLAQEETPSVAHQALRDHLGHQEEATMGNLDHQGHLDLQDHPYLDHTGAHRLSIFLDHRDHLEHQDYLDTPQG